MVDSQSVPAVTKFSHLKELLVPRVHQAIDGLPFTEEGYEHAKKYLREKYGHPDEVTGVYVINLLEMPMITERNVAKVHQFYKKLLFTIESLKTLGKLESVQGVAYYVLVKKLGFLRSELVSHMPSDRHSWSFKELLEVLRKWTDTNITSSKCLASSDRVFFSEDWRVNNSCVYCVSTDHVSSDCGEISTPEERKAFLVSKRLCFNCAAGQHSTNKCPSKLSCRTCRRGHHTSRCQQASEPSLTANIAGSSVIHPVVMVDVNGRKFHALLNSGAINMCRPL